MRYITHDRHLLCSTHRERGRKNRRVETMKKNGKTKYENEKEKRMREKRKGDGGGGGYQASKRRVN